MEFLNFNDYQVRKKTYGGANGNKIILMINGELYMLKYHHMLQKMIIYHMLIHAFQNILDHIFLIC